MILSKFDFKKFEFILIFFYPFVIINSIVQITKNHTMNKHSNILNFDLIDKFKSKIKFTKLKIF